jgi:hypothetical protein
MKKIFSTAVALLIMGSVAFAQDAKKATTTTKTKTEVKTTKHMKKDGTPDMRYKENKTTKKTETKKTETKVSK